jgi:hypothetical protein
MSEDPIELFSKRSERLPRTGQADLVHGGTRAAPDAASAFVSPEWWATRHVSLGINLPQPLPIMAARQGRVRCASDFVLVAISDTCCPADPIPE